MKQVFSSIIKIHEEIKSTKEFDANIHNQKINFKDEDNNNSSVKELTDLQREAIKRDREAFFKGK